MNRLDQLLKRMAQRPVRSDLSPIKKQVKKDFAFPESTRIIQVVGSNGKGSVVHYLSSLLTRADKSVLAYFSPHLYHPAERININGQPLSPEYFEKLLTDLPEQIFENFTPFEILFYLSLQVASEIEPDYIILEAGLGGRWDATSSISADWTVLTSIELEHTEFLGESEEEILIEKTAQIPEFGNLVAPELSGALSGKLLEIAAEKKLHLHTVVLADSIVKMNKNIAAAVFAELVPEVKAVEVEYWLGELAPPPGRREKIKYRDRLFLLDVAHTPAALLGLLEECFRGLPDTYFVFACLRGKKYKQMVELLADALDPEKIIFTETASPRSLPVEELKKVLPGAVAAGEPRRAAGEVMKRSRPGDTIVIAGSFTLVGWFKEWLH
ncbi:MAG: glutamate ligase domain-containing protein [bacterium]